MTVAAVEASLVFAPVCGDHKDRPYAARARIYLSTWKK